MARISTYGIDGVPELGDKVIGTDSAVAANLATKNYSLGEVVALFNKKNSIGVADQTIYLFQDDIQDGRESGTVSFGGGGGIGTAFSSVTTLLMSKSAAGGQSRAQYTPLFVGKDIILAELGNINNFGSYKVVSIETNVTETDFFDVTVENYYSNGSFSKDAHYIFSEFVNPASDEADKHYVHNQGTPSAIWAIEHSLGKLPSVTSVNNNNIEVKGQVQYIDNNNLTITFSAGFSGKAYLN